MPNIVCEETTEKKSNALIKSNQINKKLIKYSKKF